MRYVVRLGDSLLMTDWTWGSYDYLHRPQLQHPPVWVFATTRDAQEAIDTYGGAVHDDMEIVEVFP